MPHQGKPVSRGMYRKVNGRRRLKPAAERPGTVSYNRKHYGTPKTPTARLMRELGVPQMRRMGRRISAGIKTVGRAAGRTVKAVGEGQRKAAEVENLAARGRSKAGATVARGIGRIFSGRRAYGRGFYRPKSRKRSK
jgi:hypothetical protein